MELRWTFNHAVCRQLFLSAVSTGEFILAAIRHMSVALTPEALVDSAVRVVVLHP